MNRAVKLTIIVTLASTVMILAGCKKENSTTQPVDDTHEYVDLGLPSGTLWATCNVGANCPEDKGDYFAWGETSPTDMYDWKNYKYATYVDDKYLFVKYCTNSAYGVNGMADGKEVLEPADDAATVNWGVNWRMPTQAECEELYRNTTFEWTAVNGVDGRLLTGPNGNSIFLPATGFRQDGQLLCLGLGIYWTSTLQSACQVAAWSLHFDYENCHVCGTYERCRGQVIRPVYAK